MKNKFLLIVLILFFPFFACDNGNTSDKKDKDQEPDTGEETGITRPALGNDGINAGKEYAWDAGNLGPLTATITGNVTSAQYFYAKGLDSGWNAGNSLDASATDETAWGNAALNQALFNGVKAQGFRIVRIPVTWGSNASNQATRLERVAEVVGFAHTAGLAVIINTHHDNTTFNILTASDDASQNTTITAAFTTLWGQIAEKFKTYGDWLIFEPLNEPRVQSGGTTYWDGPPSGKEGTFDVINQWNQAFVTAVRDTGGNNAHRYLMVKGYAAKPVQVIAKVVIPTDTQPNKLIIDFHYYDPGGFCLEGNTATWTEKSNGKRIKYDFEDIYNKFGKLGYPVTIGECGVSYQGARTGAEAETAKASRLAYLEHMARTARENGLTPILWDNGTFSTSQNNENFGLFTRATGATNSDISKAAIEAFIKGARTDPESK
jgi:endoglucanase